MKPHEIRNLTTDQIQTRMNDAHEELMRLRFQQSTGELTDHTRLRKIRRNIARFMTVLAERESTMEGEK
jgi:large subunit ribosomal protein L29